MSTYFERLPIPDLVREAMELADQTGFGNSCTPGTGRLLAVLAARQRTGNIGEIGTGCGVGAAWIVSALPEGARFTTIELDGERAAVAGQLLGSRSNVTVLQGDWHAILTHGPFDLLFVDAPAKREEPEQVLAAVAPGGLVVLDDFTPEDQWPEEWRGRPDPVREFWLNDSRLRSTEIMVSRSMGVILATHIG